MVSKMNDVYERVSQKHGIDYKLAKSVGDHVLGHLKKKILDIDEGSLYIANMGSFVLKSVKVEKQLRRYLSMRAYKCKQYPDYIDKPISKKAKRLFDVYLNVIIPFKNFKRDLSERQVEFCKKTYESYANKDIEIIGN